MDKPVTAVIMLGDAGPTPVERLVHEARRKSAIATFQNLNTLDPITQIVVASPKRELAKWRSTLDFPQTSTRLVLDADHTDHDFHFGKRLISIVQKYNLERILYIGGGSMPLMNTRTLGDVVVRLSRATDKYAITNNLHSSDWLGMTSAKTIVQSASHLPRDNMLGWVLREQAGYDIRVLPPSASTRLDIDTPSDLVALRWHPDTLPLLRSFLIEQLPEEPLARWKAAARVMDTPASQIALIGRVSPSVWRTLQYNSQVWIRVFSEEQGMTASGRWGGGRVQSLLADYIKLAGHIDAFKKLEEMVDAVFFDTRVYLAHNGQWPPTGDRYASDLGQPDQITDNRLRSLTEAAIECQVPIVLGAFGVVSGGLYALIETIKAKKDWLSPK